MEIVTKYGNWKSRIADVNERDSARILLYGGRHFVIPFKGILHATARDTLRV